MVNPMIKPWLNLMTLQLTVVTIVNIVCVQICLEVVDYCNVQCNIHVCTCT